MYKEIKIDKSAVRESRKRLKKQLDEVEILKSKIEKLTFYDEAGHASIGKCANSMETVTKNMPSIIVALEQLIGKTDQFLGDALDQFSDIDNKIADKF